MREPIHDLIPELYSELKRLASRKLKGEYLRGDMHTTALVHEAFLKLSRANSRGWQWDNDEHFLRAAAQAMQRILVDYARSRSRIKRGQSGNSQPIFGDEDALAVFDVPDFLPQMDQALEELALLEPTAAELIQLRFFGGLTLSQAANSLGLSTRTAERYWTFARAWLFRRIEES